MSWISKNLALDLIAIAIGGMQSAFDRIKSEPESDWPEVPAQTPAAVAPAPQSAPAPQPEPTPAAQEPEPEASAPQQAAAEAPAPQVDRLDEAKAHLRDISLAGGMDWITGTLFPAFGVTSLIDVPADKLPDLINTATAYKLEKGLN